MFSVATNNIEIYKIVLQKKKNNNLCRSMWEK